MNAPSDASRRSPDATWAAPDTAPGPGSGLAWLSRAPARAAPPDPVLPDGEPPVGVIGAGSTVGGATVSGATIGGSTMGSGSAQGAALPGLAGGLPAGQVLTWLPDGRWVSADAEDDVVLSEPTPAPVDPGAGARRWGQRRIGLARAGARLARWPRRVLVGLLLLAAVLLAARPRPVAVTAAPAPPTTDVVVAARDLAAGTVLAAPDLRTVSLPVPVVPAGATGRPAGLVGRMAAGAIRRGETVTDTRVVGPGLTAGLGPGESAAVPVRLADPDSAALVRPGDRVDVLGTPVTPEGGQPPGGDAVDVATGVRVLAVLGGRDAADGVVLVVAATQPTARRLVGAAARHRLTVSVRPP